MGKILSLTPWNWWLWNLSSAYKSDEVLMLFPAAGPQWKWEYRCWKIGWKPKKKYRSMVEIGKRWFQKVKAYRVDDESVRSQIGMWRTDGPSDISSTEHFVVMKWMRCPCRYRVVPYGINHYPPMTSITWHLLFIFRQRCHLRFLLGHVFTLVLYGTVL